jgi:hypothetical protein
VANVIVPYSGDVFLPTTRCEPRTASALRKTHTGLYHPRKTDHGPFDFYECAMALLVVGFRCLQPNR